MQTKKQKIIIHFYAIPVQYRCTDVCRYQYLRTYEVRASNFVSNAKYDICRYDVKSEICPSFLVYIGSQKPMQMRKAHSKETSLIHHYYVCF